MVGTLIIFSVTIVSMIVGVLFFPKIRLGKVGIDSYWVITLAGALLLLCLGKVEFADLGRALVADTAINPLKILALFLSMTILSIFLDELGFFRYLASVALKRAGSGQVRLFVLLYLTVSVLTVFTSNDIIILSFTPFICYFAKNAKINAIPYLAAEFVAANTWSMALIIGNPTNIYLATAYGIGFAEYAKYSILPTLVAGTVAFCCLYLLFRKKLKAPVTGEAPTLEINDKLLLWVGIVHLAVCTIMLAIGSYIGVEMWLVSVCAVGSLFLTTGIISLVRKRKPTALFKCLKRAPYQFAPFLISMFVMIIALESCGVTAAIGELLSGALPTLKYGTLSFLTANIINNIPMSVLFSSIIESANAGLPAMFATVVGSNIGAFLTPVGALAGIMWSSILNRHGEKFGYLDFLKIGLAVAVPTLFAALGMFRLMYLFI